ncbi:MAG: SDR family oxidoreductase [Salaquimonas sp.]
MNRQPVANSKPKTALVTGASKRIGAAIARSLAEQGIDIAVHYFHSDVEAESLCEELRQTGNIAVPIKADLTNAAATRKLFADSIKAIGSIELLVNNASIFEPDSLEAPNDAQWDAHFSIHLKAPSILAAEMAKQIDLENALIVNIIDQRVRNLNPTFYSYTLSKSALWTATQTMAQALAPKIRVNGIGPGPTLANKRQSREDFEKQVQGLLLERAPELSEFGDTIKWLWQAKSVTGQLITLDGGQHLAWQTPDVNGIKE